MLDNFNISSNIASQKHVFASSYRKFEKKLIYSTDISKSKKSFLEKKIKINQPFSPLNLENTNDIFYT